MSTTCKIILAAIFTLWTQPLWAGQSKQIAISVASSVGCIKTILPGEPIASGISTGKLPGYVLVLPCDTSKPALSVSFPNGQLKSLALENNPFRQFNSASVTNALPDARITTDPGNIRQAWLTRPTRRYAHAILGDPIEAGGLAVILADKSQLEVLVDETSVFEDRMARLVDLDGNGKKEIVVIRSYLDLGAAIAIYAIKGQEIIELAQSEPIGQTNRWLNPAAAADFDGDGNVELAWVETPHIGGTLKVARLVGTGPKRQLKIIDQLYGFSNHKIGARELMLSVTFDWDGDGINDIILPDASRKTLTIVSMASGKLKIIAAMEIAGEIASPLVGADLNNDGKGQVLLVTKNGQLLSFSP